MKKYIIFPALLISLIFCFACNKTKRLPVPDKPFLNMEINGQSIQYDSQFVVGMYPDYILRDTAKRFYIGGHNLLEIPPNSYPTEIFVISLIQKKLGQQKIIGVPFSTISYAGRYCTDTTPTYGVLNTLQEAGEFLCEDFIVDNTKNNWVEIVQEEGNFKRVWGKFQLTFKRTGILNGCTTLKYGETVEITNGSFYFEL